MLSQLSRRFGVAGHGTVPAPAPVPAASSIPNVGALKPSFPPAHSSTFVQPPSAKMGSIADADVRASNADENDSDEDNAHATASYVSAAPISTATAPSFAPAAAPAPAEVFFVRLAKLEQLTATKQVELADQEARNGALELQLAAKTSDLHKAHQKLLEGERDVAVLRLDSQQLQAQVHVSRALEAGCRSHGQAVVERDEVNGTLATQAEQMRRQQAAEAAGHLAHHSAREKIAECFTEHVTAFQTQQKETVSAQELRRFEEHIKQLEDRDLRDAVEEGQSLGAETAQALKTLDEISRATRQLQVQRDQLRRKVYSSEQSAAKLQHDCDVLNRAQQTRLESFAFELEALHKKIKRLRKKERKGE